jgi:hypothetical protein
VSTVIGGEIIKQGIIHHKQILQFIKNSPHVFIASLAVFLIAARQYKSAVIQPIADWISDKDNTNTASIEK